MNKMQVHTVSQGSQEWSALRMAHFCASEAAAMMGVDPKLRRTDLLKMKKTGIEREFSDWVQSNVLDKGHEFEAAYRPIAERLVESDLYPTVGTIEIDGLKLLASFDGITMDDETVWEHKRLNAELRDSMTLGVIPEWRCWQLEQQLLVSSAKFVLFTASLGEEEGSIWLRYEGDPERRAQLIAGWKQFAADLATFQAQEYIPAPVARPVTALPAVSVQVSGAIAIRDNFADFGVQLRDFIDNQLVREPKTDQDFADLDQQIKALKHAEEALDAAEASMLAQVDSVDTAKRAKDMLHKLARDNRLMAEKLLAAKKESVKAAIIQEGRDAYDAHIRALNERLGNGYLSTVKGTVRDVDFVAAARNKRTVDSLREAVNVALTNGKVAANEVADKMEINLKTLRERAVEHKDLFPDTPQIILKANEDLVLLIDSRIAARKAEIEKKEAEQRERIRQEELARIERERQAQAEADARAAAAAAPAPVSQPNPEEPPPAAPAVAPAPPAVAETVAVAASPITSAAPTASATVLAFIASRTWPSDAAKNTARAVAIEFERFCATQRKAA